MIRRMSARAAVAAAAALAATAGAQIDPGKAALEANPALTRHPSSVLVRFTGAATSNAKAQALAAVAGARVRAFSIVPGLEQIRVGVNVDRAVAVLSSLPFVEYAEPDYVVHTTLTPNDTYFDLEWGLHNTGQVINGVSGTPDADIDAPEAWDIFTGDAGFVVAVIDTGTQWDHPDLDANMWINPGEIAGNGVDDDGNGYVDDVRGWDFYSDDNNPDDGSGHGTHTAGTVGAEGDNGTGVAGVNWRCQIMPLRFLGPYGGYTSDAVAALDYAVAKGVKVSNNSWGGGGYSTSLYDSINNAKSVGHLFIAAAGNDGVNTDSSPHYPSSYNLDNIIAVAATDNRDRLAGFSNYGAVSVDLGAPGVDIASTYPTNGYAWASGTSMATPHVAGVVSLLYAMHPDWTYQQVRDQIFVSVRPIPALAGACVTGGVLNAYDAINTGGGGNTPPTVTITAPADGSSFPEHTSVTFTGEAFDNEDGNLSSSITWVSSLDGDLGDGASITFTLSLGTHLITASVTDSGTLSGWDVITVDITGSTPAPPSDVSATDNADGTATIGWIDNADNEDAFEVQREFLHRNGTWKGTTTVATLGPDTTSYTDNPGSGTFRYSVRAINDAGASDWSAWAQVTVTGGGRTKPPKK